MMGRSTKSMDVGMADEEAPIPTMDPREAVKMKRLQNHFQSLSLDMKGKVQAWRIRRSQIVCKSLMMPWSLLVGCANVNRMFAFS
jgi:hypothetical protein